MIPLFKPALGGAEIRELRKIFRSGWIGLGPKTAEFEQRFARFIRTRYAVGVNSCTAALDLALRVLEMPLGSEVIIPAITFISCAHAARYNGLVPVFVDVDPETLVLDPADIERKITKNTKAIMAVHFAGQPCDMDVIMGIARKYKLWVVEDCANAAGSMYKGRRVGSMGDIGCFSFEAKKNITTGDGGMLTINRKEWDEKLRRLRWLGISKDTWKRMHGTKNYSWYYEVRELGYKYNMNDIQAAIGLVQLAKIDRIRDAKQHVIRRYRDALSRIQELQLPAAAPSTNPHFWLYIVRLDGRERFMAHLAERGITTGVHFMPLYLHPLYKNTHASLPVAEKEWRRMVTLPLYSGMKLSDQKKIIRTIISCFAHEARAKTQR